VKRFAIIAVVLGLFAAALVLKETRGTGASSPVAGHLDATARSPLPRLVDLGSNRCIPCRKMAPILDALRDDFRGALIVEVIDVRQHPEAAREYGIKVIPTQIFYDAEGRERSRHEGFLSREAILATFEKLGIELSAERVAAPPG
jgi:thioredoxin 1